LPALQEGNQDSCADLLSKLRGFFISEISCHAARRVAYIDRQQSNIDPPVSKAFYQTVIKNAIATVINGSFARLNDKSNKAWNQSFTVEMICVIVARSDYVNEVQLHQKLSLDTMNLIQ
jgi:hypothetical protein